MGKIGTSELILILAIALIVVGPSKLPELGKALGKTINEFKKFSKDMKVDLSLDETNEKVKKTEKVEKVETVEAVEVVEAESKVDEKVETIESAEKNDNKVKEVV